MRKALLVSALALIILVAVQPLVASAQSCTSPGTGSSTDYAYDSAANTYVVCNILSAQATIMALPTQTPDAFGCYGDQNLQAICLKLRQTTPTPTLMPTPAAVALQTGCDPYGNTNEYQSCVIADAKTRSDSYIFWAIPLILVAIIAFGAANHARFERSK